MDPIPVFLAGVASFTYPCVIGLVPVYVGLVFGKDRVIAKSIGFSIGFLVIFVVMDFLSESVRGVLIGGEIDFLLGSIMVGLGVLFLYAVIKPDIFDAFEVMIQKLLLPIITKLQHFTHQKRDQNSSIGAFVISLFLGVLLSITWAPCASPVLTALTKEVFLGDRSATIHFLYLIYGIGLLTPFLIFSWFYNSLKGYLKKLDKVFLVSYLLFGIYFLYDGFSSIFQSF